MATTSDGLTEIVTATNVDLSNCDRELIHIPGLIQPHGVMLVLRSPDLVILQASENTETLFGIPALQLHSKQLADLLGPEQGAALNSAIEHAGDRLNSGPLHLLRVPSVVGRMSFDAIGHRAGNVLILELERAAAVVPPPLDFYAEIAPNIARLQATTSLQAFLDLAVTQIHAISGFDHVMAYRFADDGSGEVVAEARRADLSAYLGQHFPASDIPAPARRLFALSWLRHLPEVEYVPVPLLPEVREQIDMSRAVLRHVSVMYSSYLKNMRVHATMVMPLMKAGRLWGLISCMHHAAPLHIPCETRTASELLAIMVSLILAEKEDLDTAAYRVRMSAAIEGLVGQMAQDPVYHRSLSSGGFTVDGWLDAPGAALVTEAGVVLFGKTPTEEQVHGIVEWLSGYDNPGPVFATDRLSQLYPPAEAFRAVASGLLAAQLVPTRPEFVMWFRPELVHVVNWAGDPSKPVQVDVVDGEARLTPRGSFELWKETVSGLSEPWQECEIEAAAALRRAIAEVILVQLNENLRRSNAELDSFAYAASHDMKEPLRGIHNFARFLQQSTESKLTAEERGRIETIIRLTRRMDDLIEALLEYSRVGRTEFALANVDLNELIKQTLDLLETQITETGTVVLLPRSFPDVRSNRALLAGVFANLVSNAIKYNDLPKQERQIEIGWRADSAGRIFYIRDNGIGIAAQHLEHVFQIFRRLHARNEYGGGSGAGLTIARRSVERLGGHLWAESAGPGTGTTFLFTLGETSADAVQP